MPANVLLGMLNYDCDNKRDPGDNIEQFHATHLHSMLIHWIEILYALYIPETHMLPTNQHLNQGIPKMPLFLLYNMQFWHSDKRNTALSFHSNSQESSCSFVHPPSFSKQAIPYCWYLVQQKHLHTRYISCTPLCRYPSPIFCFNSNCSIDIAFPIDTVSRKEWMC